MLLHSSRKASSLTKQALVGRLIGKTIRGGLGMAGKAVRRYPIPALALAGGTAGGVIFGKDLVQRARQGLSPEYLAYRRQTGFTAPGLPTVTPSGGSIHRRVPTQQWIGQLPR